ncbi:MAG: metallophosphoesterase [Clostridiaceae bacterium]|nr:metallophosphoesterase [Clostridiaceae bacterium]
MKDSVHQRSGSSETPSFVHLASEPRRRRHRIFPRILACCFTLCLLALAWGFLIEPRILTTTRLTIEDPAIPESWDGAVIAFFSDVHVGTAYPVERLGRVADAVNAARPDLILFGGDLIDHRTPTDDAYAAAVSACLARMQAPRGQYAIAGNHDNRLRAELNLMKSMLKDGGFQFLDNQSVFIDGLWLGGLEESYFGRPDLQKAFSMAGLAVDSQSVQEQDLAGAYRLVLMHQPDYAASLPAGSAGLILSGHSHNGQITFFGRPIITVSEGTKYAYGLYHLTNGSQLIVSRGLGTVGLPARFCAPPELMLITLRRSD